MLIVDSWLVSFVSVEEIWILWVFAAPFGLVFRKKNPIQL